MRWVKLKAVSLIVIAEAAALSVWFSGAASLASMAAEADIPVAALAHLATAVQIGFVIGALAIAISGLADRFDGRKLFLGFAMLAALANLALLWVGIGGWQAFLLRFSAGAALAGVYPVGMKLVLGWARQDRGLLVGLLVGALTLGTAAPHIVAALGGAEWRVIIAGSSLLAVAGGFLAVLAPAAPNLPASRAFNPSRLSVAWSNRQLRFAYAGYLGHMWELYAFWAWIGIITQQSLALSWPGASIEALARLVTIIAIMAGALACAPTGWVADRIGKARVAQYAMILSAASGLAAALSYGANPWLFCSAVILWGLSIIPDSAQFSALVSEYAAPEDVGSLLTLQTALGFLLTIATVQLLPLLAAHAGWPLALAAMAIGPILGAFAMQRLK